MDVAQIGHALAVIDHGGFSRAAQALGLSQPSVSQAVRRLEDELGVALFRRVGRTVEPTDAGRAFEGPARAVLRDMAALAATVASHRRLETGVLQVGALPTLATTVVAGVLVEFRRRYPGVTVQVADERRPGPLLDMAADGRCEVVFTEGPVRRPGLVSVALGRQELLAVLPPGTDPAPRHITLEHLAALPLVLAPPGTSVREQLMTACARAGLAPWVAVEMPQREAIVPLVLAGAGATVVPSEQAREAEARGARVAPVVPPLGRDLSLVHADRDLSPAAVEVVAIARRAYPGATSIRVR